MHRVWGIMIMMIIILIQTPKNTNYFAYNYGENTAYITYILLYV